MQLDRFARFAGKLEVHGGAVGRFATSSPSSPETGKLRPAVPGSKAT
jgi:hypothetical protein